ncbi:MAG: ABC transporter ATP-binding protein [Cellulosilyticaceae bacterium]
MTVLLEMKHITKTYDNVIANNDVNINLNKGEILAIVGENGAGKSTIMKILYGLQKPDSGSIHLDGKKVVFHNPSDAMAHGIGMIQQHFMLFESMTVAENIVYKNEARKGLFYDEQANIKVVEGLSKKYGLGVDAKAIIKDCSVGLQQRVEILKVLYQDADIIIFDEPSAVLTPGEVAELLKTMKNLAALGKSLIIITHKLDEVMEVADRIVVMRTGVVVDEMLKTDTNPEKLSEAMIGRQILTRQIEEKQAGECLLDVKDLVLTDGSLKPILDRINLQVRSGEIVGIAGVSGNGQSELIRCITGLQKSNSGHVHIKGQDITNKQVFEIREAGIAHIPEDRYVWGSAKEASLIENALIGYEDEPKFSRRGILNLKAVQEHALDLIKEYKVKVGSAYQQIKGLSGGNAQKLIAAREITRNTPILIACEPTRGIDIGAMEFIHDRLVEKRDKGDGILLVSSELSEIMSLSDRIYVIYDGQINGEFKKSEVDEKELGMYMLGGKKHENA